MSQPHDVHRSFFPSGNPFRMIFPKGSSLSPKLLALLGSFENSLAESLKRLKPEDMSDIFSLSWLIDAMSFLSETHINIKNFITDLEFPVADWEEKWIDVFLDSSVKLLDVCIALSSELSRLDHGQLFLQYVLHVLQFSGNYPSPEQLERSRSSLCDWIRQVNSSNPKLEDCNDILQGLAGTLCPIKVKNSTKGKVLMRALYGVKVVTIFVYTVFISMFSGCSRPPVTLVVPVKFLWVEAFNDLQADVLKEILGRVSEGKVIKLKELDDVEKCAKRLSTLCDCIEPKETTMKHGPNICHNEIVASENNQGKEDNEKWQEPVSQLAEGAQKLSLQLDLLSKQVGDFFHIVLTGRDALLCNLRASDDVIMQERNIVDESL